MKKYILVFALFTTFVINTNFVFAADEKVEYKLLETIGNNTKDTSVNFPQYIQNIYKFALGFVALAALLMISLGGFGYMTAAGNQAQAGTSKKLITDAILGLIIVFVSWLILYTINPDLINAKPGMEGLKVKFNTVSVPANSPSMPVYTPPPANSSRSTWTGKPPADPEELKEILSTEHTDPNVVQKAEGPQTYCFKVENLGHYVSVCANSKEECEVEKAEYEGAGKCIEAANSWDENKLYNSMGGGMYTEESKEFCEAYVGSCMSGAQMKAVTRNNNKTTEEIDEEIRDLGGLVKAEAKKKLNNMTGKTLENAKKIIEVSEGGVVTDVKEDGVTYEMQGIGKGHEKDNGTEFAVRGETIKGLEKMYKENDGWDITKTEVDDGDRTYVKYEFDSDYEDQENLKGTVATYFIQHGVEDGLPTKAYSDVTIVAAQDIKEESK